MVSPLNRRGSRSEGRINLAIQDRIAEGDRVKKEPKLSMLPPKACIDGITGVTIVTNDSNDPKGHLGLTKSHLNRPIGELRPRTADLTKINTNKWKPFDNNSHRAHSVDKVLKSINDCNVITTTILTDSSTISIPIQSPVLNLSTASVPKYKTMPSPTRTNTILPGANCLNEIFEEGTDVGSSDSATTTPRPITRQNHFTSNRTQSQGPTAHRRSKFHKTRTASCSSSDASDDDSENRKKRAHKIVDVSKPTSQRRDSHDDSSDSQDPGNTAASGSNTNSSHIIHITAAASTSATTTTTTNSESSGNNSNSNGRQKNVQQMGFRRHRAGRRRAGETRLRESQSLNRITEVQESEPVPIQPAAVNPAPQSTAPAKPKGFSARLFHGFKRTEQTPSPTPPTDSRLPVQNDTPDDDVEMVLGSELAKALRVTETKTSSATKKLKILGKYFQVIFAFLLIFYYFFYSFFLFFAFFVY